MKRSLFFLSILAFFFILVSCQNTEHNFHLRGELQNGAEQELYLFEVKAIEIEPLDTIRTDKHGHFRYDGYLESIRFLLLRTSKPEQIYLLAHPGDRITVSGDLQNLKASYKVEGSEDSRLVQKLNQRIEKTIFSLDSISRNYQEKLSEPGIDFEELRLKTRMDYEAISNSQREFTIDFIKNNTTSIASIMALYQQIESQSLLLSEEGDFRYYVLVDSVLGELYPEVDYVKTLRNNVSEMLEALDAQKRRTDPLSDGALAPEIELPNPEGKKVALSSLRGNYVLLDFWAAWCPPCRKENPHLVKVYDKYHDKGFTIYQVSLDRTREAWLKGIEDDKIGQWTHVSDLKFWNSSVVPAYQLQAIPASFLLDREGRIIARNLRGEELEQKLAEIFD
jgi:peroxiredoxin